MHGTKRLDPHIDWNYPAPRTGGLGKLLDHFCGPGATRAEIILQFIFAFGGAALVFFYIRTVSHLSTLQITVAVYLAFDLCGGIATNATSSGKRWWHGAEKQTLRRRMKFLVPHFYMPLLVSIFFLEGRFAFTFFFVSYIYLLIAATVALKAPLYLRRVLLYIFFTGGIFIAIFYLILPEEMYWFLPLFYFKLLISCMGYEEPYRPERERCH